MASAAAPPDLDAPLLGLPGIGPKTAERFAEAGVRTRAALLDLVPRRWDDLRDLTPVRDLVPGAVQVTVGEVTSSRFLFGRRRSLEVRLRGEDGTGRLVCRWFVARGSMKERFAPGTRWLVSGMVREHRGERVMAHPETRALGEGDEGVPAGVVARYPEIEGVPARVVMGAARHLAQAVGDALPDPLPPSLCARRGLPSRGAAIALLHVVANGDALPAREEVRALNAGTHPAQRRLAYEELLALQLVLARRRAQRGREAAPPCASATESGSDPYADPFAGLSPLLAVLGFSPTGAQHRALGAIGADLARPHPMHRLLQGDVGAGKTVVMYAAAERVMAAGYQVAVMAPTELLAEQHARTLSPWAAATGRRLALLTAGTPRPAREAALCGAQDGAVDLLVGTHALLSEAVRFSRLGLVVVDEQHRFGVAQRAALRGKATGGTPHLLVMTATPIPRTLALTLWGDLDVTTLDELPPGRSPPRTLLLLGKRGRARGWEELRAALDAGRRGYLVCPRVGEAGDDGGGEDGDGDPDVGSAVATFERLQRELPGVRAGLLHGRLPAAERDATMRAFADGALQLLVATTVIEVGVDVPDADLLLVEGAERFGLAQLHQLRGRIGRAPMLPGAPRPLCLLLSDVAAGSDAARRLEELAETTDGFAIAEADLRARGPGELFGTRQAGLPRLRFADPVRDLDLLTAARDDAAALLGEDPALARPEHALLRATVDAHDAAVYAEEAG